ncbi:MAG: hypothetical protein ACOYXT_24445 [Bacteroidota bacterium]
MRVIVVLLLVFKVFVLPAQNDSLRRELTRHHPDTTRVLLYVNLGYSFIVSDADSLAHYATQGYHLEKKRSDIKEVKH